MTVSRITCFLLFFLGASFYSFGQSASISGSVMDTANQKKLQYAIVTILNPTDSSIIQFTRTDKNGTFSLSQLDSGTYSIMISYPQFADYVDEVRLQPDIKVNLGTINLTNKSVLLKEIIIRQNNAMRIKGDTIEYTADSFKVRANASAEELLKNMPGIQVDKNGKIIAQGQEVQKVLVDGEEFFSDDPTVATRNIRADAVDKVQVFDKKSDQAEFTGIDDGQKTKTINLKLKEDKKNGYFGKVSAGGGLKDKFNNEGMVNFFKGKRKIAAFGTMSNTGTTGLNWQDSRKYGLSDDNFEYDENGGFFYFFGQSNTFDFNGNGLPKAWTGGLHFSNKWNEDKNNFNASYLYKKLNVTGNDDTKTQYILPDTLYYMNQQNNNFSLRDRHTLSGKYEIQLDSSSSIKLTINGYKGQSKSENQYSSEALNEASDPVNKSNRETSNINRESSFNSNVIYRKKFKKQGRTITGSLEQKYNEDNANGYLNALTHYFDASGNIFQNDTINQRKYNHSKLFTFNGKITYTEPVIRDNFIIFNYGLSNTASSADRTTYDYNQGKYDELNDLLTNDYDFLITTHAGGLAYRIAKKQYNLTFGSDLASQNYTQKDKIAASSLHYNRLNLYPKVNYFYNFKPQTRLGINYNGSTQQPTIQQLQPIQENNDPLNIFIGNPDLKPAFNHNFSVNFNDYKVLRQRSIYANINLNLIDHAISSSNTVDKLGKRIYQSVNTNGSYNYYSYFSYGMQIPSIKTWINAGLQNNGGRMTNFVNNDRNITSNNSTSLRLSGSYYEAEKMNIRINANASYNTSVSSINKAIKTNYWIHSYGAHLYFALPFKFEFTNDIDFNFRQKTSVFDENRNTVIWNSNLTKLLFKETCSLEFSVNDILDQNIGFNRNIQSNFITENTYTTLRRFWMLSFTWNFTKNNAQTQNQ